MNIGGFLISINRFDLLVVLFLFGDVRPGLHPGHDPAAARPRVDALLVPASRRTCASRSARSSPRTGTSSRTSTRSCSASGSCSSPATIAFTLVIQGFYHQQPLFEKTRSSTRSSAASSASSRALFLVGVHHRDPRLVLPDPGRSPSRRRAAVPARLLRVYRRLGDGEHLPRSQLIPGFYHGLRPAHPGRPPGVLLQPAEPTPAATSCDRRRSSAGRPSRSRRALLGARLVRGRRPRRPAGRPDRRGRGVHRRGRPGLPRPVRADRPERGHVRACRASPTCTLSTGCTTA